MSTFGQRWMTKPPRGTLIDRSHPWVGPALMMGFYALNEGTGVTAGDSVGTLPMTAFGYGASSPWSSASQSCVASTGVLHGLDAALPTRLRVGWPITVMAAFRILAAPSAGDNAIRPFGLVNNPTASAPYGPCMIFWFNPFNLYIVYNSTATLTAKTLAPGVDYVIAQTIGSNAQAVYVNGASVYSNTASIAAPVWVSPHICVGVPNQSSTSAPNLLCYWAGWWNSALPAATHAAIGSNVNAIWQVMQPARTVVWFGQPFSYGTAAPSLGPLSAAAPGTFATSAAATLTLGSLTAASSATFATSSAASVALASLTAAAAGTDTSSAAAALTLGSLTALALGTFDATSAANPTLGSLTASAAGTFHNSASAAITLTPLTAAAAGTFHNSASAAITLTPLTAAAAGTFDATAAAAITLASTTAHSLGTFTTIAAAAISLHAMTASGSGTYKYIVGTPDPSQATWSLSTSTPDPSQATWSLSTTDPDPSQAQWTFFK